MEKYTLLRDQLLHEGTVEAKQFFEPVAITKEELTLTHCPHYVQELEDGSISPRKMRVIGFPYSPQLIERELSIASGTWQCVGHAFQDGISFNLAGGTHHAYTNKGEGFCLYNDNAVAANLYLRSKPEASILILDLDVHQGNGTAEIFNTNSSVQCVSFHGKNNYPLKKEQSDWDIALEDLTTDEQYLARLEKVLGELGKQHYDLMFFQAGVDVLADDKLGRLGLSLQGCKERDEMVLNWASERETPLVVTMGGGYSPCIKTIIEAHANTYRLANKYY